MSLKSMTAFGSDEFTSPKFVYRCEIRTLNSRFCDVSIKMPRGLIHLEPKLLNHVKERILRGKVDVFIDLSPSNRSANLPRLNPLAVGHYQKLCQELEGLTGPNLKPLSTFELLRLEGVLDNHFNATEGEKAEDQEHALLKVVDSALSDVIKQRQSEGKALEGALHKILTSMRIDREAILAKREPIQKQLYENYRKRLDRLINSMDDMGTKLSSMLPEDRVLGEVALLIDRADVEEELIRLAAHEAEFHRLLKGGEEVGRKMDFLCQEMHREVNTISNKLTQLEIAQHSLSLKQSVERLRQQVANIE